MKFPSGRHNGYATFLETLGPTEDYRRPHTKFEVYCEEKGPLSRTISKMYALLSAPPEDFIMPGLRKWERDLDQTFTPSQRQNIIYLSIKSLRCTKTQELNYKLLTRWYYTPQTLNNIFPATSDRCWRGCEEQGTLLHIFCLCPIIRQFCQEIQRIINKRTEYQIPDDLAFFLLQYSQIPLKKYKNSVLSHLVNAAKSCIASCWKDPRPPHLHVAQ